MTRWILFTVLFLGCVAPSKKVENYHPEQAAYWQVPPVIEICDNLPVDLEFLVAQLNWWQEEVSPTYEHGELVFSGCTKVPESGVIRFQLIEDYETLAKNGWGAYTFMAMDLELTPEPPFVMNFAVVNLQSANNSAGVRHEIGHAFGWAHTPEDGHVMTPWPGESIMGLDKYP